MFGGGGALDLSHVKKFCTFWKKLLEIWNIVTKIHSHKVLTQRITMVFVRPIPAFHFFRNVLAMLTSKSSAVCTLFSKV